MLKQRGQCFAKTRWLQCFPTINSFHVCDWYVSSPSDVSVVLPEGVSSADISF